MVESATPITRSIVRVSVRPGPTMESQRVRHRVSVTVSGIQFGKQELAPASQIPEVDALWREQFPASGVAVCPLFAHAGDQLNGDISLLEDMPPELKAFRVIVAGPRWDNVGLTAKTMTQQEVWNGVTWQDTQWDGLVASAVEEHVRSVVRGSDEYRRQHTPTPDWLVVTVDYHT